MESTLSGLYTSERELSWNRYPNNNKFDGGLTVSEAFHKLDLDFDVKMRPMFIPDNNGGYTEVPGKNAIVAEHKGATSIFGTTGSDYRPLQNREIAKLLDPLTEQWALQNVAISNHGRDLLIVLKIDDTEVNGEQLTEYFWGQTSHDGLKAVKFMLTPVRLFCTNQLITGMRSASFRAQVSHTEAVAGELAFQISIFKLMEAARRQIHQTFEQMGHARLNDEQIQAFLERVYPEPNMPRRVQMLHALAAATANTDGSLDENFRETLDADQLEATDEAHSTYEHNLELTQLLRKDCKTLLEKFNDEHGSALANTGWAIYNAAVELADFRGPARTAQSAAMSALTGVRAQEKERAFSTVMKTIQPNWTDMPAMVDGAAGDNALLRKARETARAEREARAAERADQRAAERYAKAVAEGRIKPRLDAEGNELPPLTADELAAERAKKEAEQIAKLEKQLEDKRARLKAQQERLEATTRTAAQRIEDRKAAALRRSGERNTAVLERADAIAADQDTEPSGPEVGTLDLSNIESTIPEDNGLTPPEEIAKAAPRKR